MLYIKLTKIKGAYRIEFSGKSIKGSKKIIKMYTEKHFINKQLIPQLI